MRLLTDWQFDRTIRLGECKHTRDFAKGNAVKHFQAARTEVWLKVVRLILAAKRRQHVAVSPWLEGKRIREPRSGGSNLCLLSPLRGLYSRRNSGPKLDEATMHT
jgi:hypothetical protein